MYIRSNKNSSCAYTWSSENVNKKIQVIKMLDFLFMHDYILFVLIMLCMESWYLVLVYTLIIGKILCRLIHPDFAAILIQIALKWWILLPGMYQVYIHFNDPVCLIWRLTTISEHLVLGAFALMLYVFNMTSLELSLRSVFISFKIKKIDRQNYNMLGLTSKMIFAVQFSTYICG